MRSARNLRTFCFREYLNVFREIFVRTSVFFAAWLTLSQPVTPVRNVTNLWIFCFRDYLYAFRETICPVTLYSLIRSLSFILFYIFIPLIPTSPHYYAFHIFYFTLFFFFIIYLTPCGIFFSSLIRPHSSNILLSNVSSFVDAM